MTTGTERKSKGTLEGMIAGCPGECPGCEETRVGLLLVETYSNDELIINTLDCPDCGIRWDETYPVSPVETPPSEVRVTRTGWPTHA